jgi:hypothetical protein
MPRTTCVLDQQMNDLRVCKLTSRSQLRVIACQQTVMALSEATITVVH